MPATISPALRDRSPTRYLREIRGFPLLTGEQELLLARRWQERGDLAAVHTLMTSHLRLVAKLAMGYGSYGLSLMDLIAEGNIGLMQATKRFNPDLGFRLATYAKWWIRAAIQEFILRNWSLVKMGRTGAQRKLFFNLRRLKCRLQVLDEGDLPPQILHTIATELNVPEAAVVDMNRRLARADYSLNAPLSGDGSAAWQDRLADDSDGQEAEFADREELHLRSRHLRRAVQVLTERERRIVSERHLRDEPATLEDLSQHYSISRERVRQIESRALEKLQKAMRSAVRAA